MHILPAGLATPSPSMTVDPDVVTPGFIGFVAIALVAVVVFFAAHMSVLPLWAQVAYLALSVLGPVAWTAVGLGIGASLRRAGVARTAAGR